ncbi:TIGR02302 family protein [Ostreiculturibacter nitratireducens]|uniref:TIGR02302 family protein n=1 Tax=Ostreiculturibacter nitratireducens TaxID=3075226 RepID=UPI0031B5A29C
MTDTEQLTAATLYRLRWSLRLTRAGMVAERAARAFWPVSTLLLALATAFAFGLQDHMSEVALWVLAGLWLLALAVFAVLGFRRFHWPTSAEALDRLDRTLPGRPIAAMTDAQALGAADAGSVHVWRAHLQRMADRARGARPVSPDLRLSSRDRFALRYVAATGFVMAMMFGTLGRVTEVADIGMGGTAAQAAAGPAWEGWVEPPTYTGRPSLYLNDIAAETLDIPEGSRITLRLYGEPDAISVSETLSALSPVAAKEDGSAAEPQSVRAVEFEAVRSGTLTVDGAGGRSWDITVLDDTAPLVTLAGEVKREADGQMSQPFTASDDYAVVRGRAEFTLDLDAMDRRHGLAAEPEQRETLIFDLPMPISGSRADFTEALVENASKHPWANLPVRMTFFVEDARGQLGQSETQSLPLPGRRFFDPLAAALIEMRRDLLWTHDNGHRTSQVLRAITNEPEGLFRNQRAYLMLRVAMRRLDTGLAQGPLSTDLRDEIAEALWEIAVLVEDGGLSDALERMQRAQERLSEAIRNGASPEEIQELMDELRQATDEYIRMLAERGETDPADRFTQDQPSQQITGDQLQEMMDEIQRLMEEGRMAEAQELLEQLNRMMQNLRVTQGQGGEGMQSPGQQAMRDLQDTLRQQQGLSDETFRDLQNQFGQQGQQDLDGQQPGEQQGQQGEGQQGEGQQGQDGEGSGPGQGSLADRQRALRDQLRGQLGNLPGSGEDADEARRRLGDAGRAMDEAEEALRQGDRSGALDRQAEAIENLREGMRNLGEALAQEQRERMPGQQGEAFGEAGREVPRDPLGRSAGQSGRLGTDENLLQGEDIYRRAQDLLDEIRRRSGDQSRPLLELDYLKRLLDRF